MLCCVLTWSAVPFLHRLKVTAEQTRRELEEMHQCMAKTQAVCVCVCVFVCVYVCVCVCVLQRASTTVISHVPVPAPLCSVADSQGGAGEPGADWPGRFIHRVSSRVAQHARRRQENYPCAYSVQCAVGSDVLMC